MANPYGEPPTESEMSNSTVNGVRLTWRELADVHLARAQRAERWAELLHDLDRCEHGRHEGDVCSGCGGPSHGNPILFRAHVLDGATQWRQMGFTMSGRPIVFPLDRAARQDPAAWSD